MTTTPNLRDMLRHIELLTEPWAADGIDASMEIRCLQEGLSPVSLRLNPLDADYREETLSQALQLNERGWNVYVCVNPINSDWVGAAKDDAISATYFAFVDADDVEAAERIVGADVAPDFVVHTGGAPYSRLHAYWRVDGIPDLAAWRDMKPR